ncbi:MAG: hypothetical protein ACOX81_06905 [Candidatus Heteroscillospira sp.]
MNRKYDEAMEHIEVTPEMRSRILSNIENIDFKEKAHAKPVRFPKIKRFAAAAACLAVTLAGALTIPYLWNPSDESPVFENNSIAEVSSAEELSETVGFEVEEPGALPFAPQDIVYTAYWTELAEITYTGDGQTAVFRKGTGSEDISGDYNSYESTAELSADGAIVTLKGSGELYTLASWTSGEFAYSLLLSDGIGEAEWLAVLQSIH